MIRQPNKTSSMLLNLRIPKDNTGGHSFNTKKSLLPEMFPWRLMDSLAFLSPPPVLNTKFSAGSITRSFQPSGISFLDIKFLPAPESRRKLISTGALAAGTWLVLESDTGFKHAIAAMIAVTALLNTCGKSVGDILLKTFLHSFFASLTAAYAVGIAVAAATDETAATPADADDFVRGFGPLYRLFLSCKYSHFSPWNTRIISKVHTWALGFFLLC